MIKPGQTMTQWWQDYSAGRLTTPQAVYRAARAEAAHDLRFFETPPDGPVWDAPERLAVPGFRRHPMWLTYCDPDRVDWSQTDSRLKEWSTRFVASAWKRRVPLYVSPTDLRSVDIKHCLFHDRLSPMEWRFLRVIGSLALDRYNASVLKPDRLSLSWSVTRPAEWRISRVTP